LTVRKLLIVTIGCGCFYVSLELKHIMAMKKPKQETNKVKLKNMLGKPKKHKPTIPVAI